MSLIPEKLTQFKVYGGASLNELFGSSDVELPSFEAMTETISGAGIAGEYESPVPGHFGSQTVKIKWRTITTAALGLLAPVMHVLDIRGSIQIQDTSSGALTSQAVRVALRGQIKSKNLGKLEPGKMMEAESEIEIAKIEIAMGGIPVIELDKFNSVFKVNGVDYLRQVRVDLGGV